METLLFFKLLIKFFFIDLENDERFKVIQSENIFHTTFVINNKFYVREDTDGLKVLSNDSLMFVPGGEKMFNTFIFGMIPQQDGKILITTRAEGFYLFNPNATNSEKGITHFDNELTRLMAIYRNFGTIQLADGRYVFATLTNGIFIADENLNLLQIINKETGLSDNNILGLI